MSRLDAFEAKVMKRFDQMGRASFREQFASRSMDRPSRSSAVPPPESSSTVLRGHSSRRALFSDADVKSDSGSSCGSDRSGLLKVSKDSGKTLPTEQLIQLGLLKTLRKGQRRHRSGS